MSKVTFEVFKEIANKVSSISRDVVDRTFRSAQLKSRTKGDRSLVSEADEEIERCVSLVIRAAFPSHGILGEEFNSTWPTTEYVWTIDPIDGTTPFVYGIPLFGSLLGLVRDGVPCFGSICLPTVNETLIGDGYSAFCNGKPISVDNTTALSDAVLLTSDLTELAKLKQRDGFNRMIEDVYIARTWGDCFGYAMVAKGEASIMMDAGLNGWDIAPLVPVLIGAGALVTDFDGNPVTDGKGYFSQSCLAAPPALHAQVLEALRSASIEEIPAAVSFSGS